MLVLCYHFCHVLYVMLETLPTVQFIKFAELGTWDFDARQFAMVGGFVQVRGSLDGDPYPYPSLPLPVTLAGHQTHAKAYICGTGCNLQFACKAHHRVHEPDVCMCFDPIDFPPHD